MDPDFKLSFPLVVQGAGYPALFKPSFKADSLDVLQHGELLLCGESSSWSFAGRRIFESHWAIIVAR